MRRFRMVLIVLLAAACSNGRVSTGSSTTSRDAEQRYEADLTVLESPDHGPQLCHLVATSYPPQCGGPDVIGWDWAEVEGAESANGTTWGSYHVVGIFDGTTFHLVEASEPSGRDDDPGRDFSPACDAPDVVDASQGAVEWEAMSQDFGPFEIPELVAAWVTNPGAESEVFVGNVIVRPGAAEAALTIVREHYGGPLCLVEQEGPTEAELMEVQDAVTEHHERLRLLSASTDERAGKVLVEVWIADAGTVAFARDRWGDVVQLVGILQPVA